MVFSKTVELMKYFELLDEYWVVDPLEYIQ